MSYPGLSLALLSLGLLSCTADNPLYVPESIGDGGVAHDLAIGGGRSDQGAPGVKDLSPPPTACTNGERLCSAVASERCELGKIVVDRTCPMGSQCMTGYCQPPPIGQHNVGNDCVGASGPNDALCALGLGGSSTSLIPSCQPFVSAAMTGDSVTWVCAPPVGTGFSKACSSDSECRSGFCGGNGFCFRACGVASDCLLFNGPNNFTCQKIAIQVEGQSVVASSCVPN